MQATLESPASTVTLNNGIDIPLLGMGTFQIEDGPDCVSTVRDGLAIGYRLIDTAAFYGNEASVGQAIREFGERKDLFITTKVWNDDHGYDATQKALDTSLGHLGMDQVDLYLVHWPCGTEFMDTWRAMEKLLADGKTRAIGVSNFMVPHLETLLAGCSVPPAVNQVEFHPWLVQPPLHAFHRENNILSQAWSPLMQGRFGEVAELVDIARQTGKHPTQVLVRWALQLGVATIPKSADRAHLESNADVFDFVLTDEQMHRLNGVEQRERLGPNPFELAVG